MSDSDSPVPPQVTSRWAAHTEKTLNDHEIDIVKLQNAAGFVRWIVVGALTLVAGAAGFALLMRDTSTKLQERTESISSELRQQSDNSRRAVDALGDVRADFRVINVKLDQLTEATRDTQTRVRALETERRRPARPLAE